MDTLSEMLKVQVDFNQSHLLFPTLIQWLLLVLLGLMALVYGPPYLARSRAARGQAAPATRKPADWVRLGGFLALTAVWFMAMEPVGRLLPNTGLGFLLTSMPYGVALSWLFVHDLNRHKWRLIAASSVVTPLVVWAVFAYLFKITLP
jgi:hypothetical protein